MREADARPEGALAKCGVLQPHMGEVCGDHLGTLHSGCSRESSRAVCTGPTKAVGCLCAVCPRLSRRRAWQVRACARRKIAIGLADLSCNRGIW
jgi:hypothetical protein